MFSLVIEFFTLLPSFWRQFQQWKQYSDEKDYEKYVARREEVMGLLTHVTDTRSAFNAAVAVQQLIRSGK